MGRVYERFRVQVSIVRNESVTVLTNKKGAILMIIEIFELLGLRKRRLILDHIFHISSFLVIELAMCVSSFMIDKRC